MPQSFFSHPPPSPALISQEAARRLPRSILLLLCLAYVLPGLLGRDPWKSADVTAFGYMSAIASGLSPWLDPAIAQIPGPNNLLPYWLGAVFIKALGPWIGAPLAARIPFSLLLAGVLWMTRSACFSLAYTEAARPTAFAFGGEAKTEDYARALADGSLLALIAALGLLQLGHETTPELGQLLGSTMFLFGVSKASYRPWVSRVTVLFSLLCMSASGSPTMACALGFLGFLICRLSGTLNLQRLQIWILASIAAASIYAFSLHLWAWRWGETHVFSQVLRLLAWFTWPTWPLVLWTLWQWRHHWNRRHIALPFSGVLVGVVACLFMGGHDRALMISLPGMAILAAFALPTLRKSMSAAIDWFSVFFFSFGALLVWGVYLSLTTGFPAKPAQNVARLLPGLPPLVLHPWIVLCALACTLAWVVLVVWRANRYRHPVWTSLVLPAFGVALIWLLVMSLTLPTINYARSYQPYIDKVMDKLGPEAKCLRIDGPTALLAAFESNHKLQIFDDHGSGASECNWRLISIPIQFEATEPPPGWRLISRLRRPGDKDESAVLYERIRRL